VNILYDDLIERSPVLDRLSTSLLLSNIILIRNDPVNKSNIKLIKNYNGRKDYETIEQIIDQAYKYKDQYIELKSYFNSLFNKAKQEKMLHEIDKEMVDICKEGK
jgi:hypothetical protein